MGQLRGADNARDAIDELEGRIEFLEAELDEAKEYAKSLERDLAEAEDRIEELKGELHIPQDIPENNYQIQ